MEESEKRRRKKIRAEKESEERAGARKGRKFETVKKKCFGAPEGLNVGSLKRRVRSHQMRHQKLHAVVARSKF